MMKDSRFPSMNMKVLVVDDEPSICWGFERLLGEEGFEVLVASSAEAGLRLAEKNQFALVLLDVRLPGEDGLSALPKFRAATNEAPVVVMTAQLAIHGDELPMIYERFLAATEPALLRVV